MLKAVFVLEILTFLSCFFDYVEIQLGKSKFMTSQSEQQKMTIHTFSNISRGKGNQTVKFGQLIEYNMVKKLVETPFIKKIKIVHISGSTV